MRIRLLLSALFLLGLSTYSFSQSKGENIHPVSYEVELRPELSLKELYAEMEGTFEVEITEPNYQILYTRELLETIEAARLNTDEAYITWDQYTTIVVFPHDAIMNTQPSNPN